MHQFDLPINLYTAEQSREIDAKIIQQLGVTGIELMHRAAKAVLNAILNKYTQIKSIVIFCGAGNNAGDGYILAMLAKKQGINVKVFAIISSDRLKGDAIEAFALCKKHRVNIQQYTNQQITADVVVDALLGTGLNGVLKEPFQQVINYINTLNIPVFSIDVPSGLSSDTGVALPIAIKANTTVCVLSLKQGLLTAMAKDHTGYLIFNDLDINKTFFHQTTVKRLAANRFNSELLSRDHYSHKGTYGHLLIAGGNYGMPGAVIMAAGAAMHSGVGLITVATRKDHAMPLAIKYPEIMSLPVAAGIAAEYLANKQAILIGPGLGRDLWAKKLLSQIITTATCPIILDADALYLIHQNINLLAEITAPLILTPHPKELATLLGISTKDVQRDRFSAVKNLYRKIKKTATNCEEIITILKGSGTLIYDGNETMVCYLGNPGMSVAGMGDVLSGVISSLLATGMSAKIAAEIGVFVHSQAADIFAEQRGYIGILATEIIPLIRSQLNQLTNNHFS